MENVDLMYRNLRVSVPVHWFTTGGEESVVVTPGELNQAFGLY